MQPARQWTGSSAVPGHGPQAAAPDALGLGHVCGQAGHKRPRPDDGAAADAALNESFAFGGLSGEADNVGSAPGSAGWQWGHPSKRPRLAHEAPMHQPAQQPVPAPQARVAAPLVASTPSLLGRRGRTAFESEQEDVCPIEELPAGVRGSDGSAPAEGSPPASGRPPPSKRMRLGSEAPTAAAAGRPGVAGGSGGSPGGLPSSGNSAGAPSSSSTGTSASAAGFPVTSSNTSASPAASPTPPSLALLPYVPPLLEASPLGTTAAGAPPSALVPYKVEVLLPAAGAGSWRVGLRPQQTATSLVAAAAVAAAAARAGGEGRARSDGPSQDAAAGTAMTDGSQSPAYDVIDEDECGDDGYLANGGPPAPAPAAATGAPAQAPCALTLWQAPLASLSAALPPLDASGGAPASAPPQRWPFIRGRYPVLSPSSTATSTMSDDA